MILRSNTKWEIKFRESGESELHCVWEKLMKNLVITDLSLSLDSCSSLYCVSFSVQNLSVFLRLNNVIWRITLLCGIIYKPPWDHSLQMKRKMILSIGCKFAMFHFYPSFTQLVQVSWEVLAPHSHCRPGICSSLPFAGLPCCPSPPHTSYPALCSEAWK